MEHKSLVDHIADHPKLAGFLALLAFAPTFSPRASVMATWVCLLIAWLFASTMILGLPTFKTRGYRKTGTAIASTLVAAALFVYGHWLTTPKTEANASASGSVESSSPRLKATLMYPSAPELQFENLSDTVAKDVSYEMILYRSSDLAFITFPTQNVGYVKAHSKTLPYEMVSSPQASSLRKGDILTGSLSIDCPDCTGVTYLVQLVWKEGGWYCERPSGKGQLELPSENNIEIAKYISWANQGVPSKDKRPID